MAPGRARTASAGTRRAPWRRQHAPHRAPAPRRRTVAARYTRAIRHRIAAGSVSRPRAGAPRTVVPPPHRGGWRPSPVTVRRGRPRRWPRSRSLPRRRPEQASSRGAAGPPPSGRGAPRRRSCGRRPHRGIEDVGGANRSYSRSDRTAAGRGYGCDQVPGPDCGANHPWTVPSPTVSVDHLVERAPRVRERGTAGVLVHAFVPEADDGDQLAVGGNAELGEHGVDAVVDSKQPAA